MSQIDRRFRLARYWSNRELARVGHLFGGDIVNVSAGEDNDKEGNTYISYFPNSRGYYLTNYCSGSFRGYQGRKNEFPVDLTKDLPCDLVGRFDVAFSHTTLEHIFEVRTAFRNICLMSRDIVISIVPFAQVQHECEAYDDFWRFTPTCMRRLYQENGLEVIYEAFNNNANAAVYLFVIGSRAGGKWVSKMPPFAKLYPAGEWIGQPSVRNYNFKSIAVPGAIVRNVRRVIKVVQNSLSHRIFERLLW